MNMKLTTFCQGLKKSIAINSQHKFFGFFWFFGPWPTNSPRLYRLNAGEKLTVKPNPEEVEAIRWLGSEELKEAGSGFWLQHFTVPLPLFSLYIYIYTDIHIYIYIYAPYI